MEQQTGKTISMAIAAYMVIKGIINLTLGFGAGNLITLIVSAVLAYTLIKGIKYCNYVTCAYLAILFIANVVPNISGHHWFYLMEGIIDAVCAYMLAVPPAVREYFDSER